MVNILLERLKPFSTEEGGPLKIQQATFIEGRPNLLVQYEPEGATGTVAFVGSHLDVVPANPEEWTVDPFTMSRDGDKLYGRGTTDCLGHVALITEFLVLLAETKPKLSVTITTCFIASEENATIPEVGVDMVVKHGYLDHIKAGPVYWIDSADSEPCIGTAAAIQWKVRAEGKIFHSGLPHKGINALELASEAVAELQKRFYADFPPHEQEKLYQFSTPSTMKPTKVSAPDNSVNQVPAWLEIEGDIRLTPFYNVEACKAKVEEYIADINKNIQHLRTRGPCSRYVITEEDGNEKRGIIKLEWMGEAFKGIACQLDSKGHKALVKAHEIVRGEAKPYSICGSLPLVGDLQEAGFDVQVSGYGKSSVYHGTDEYCLLSDMQDALKILAQAVILNM